LQKENLILQGQSLKLTIPDPDKTIIFTDKEHPQTPEKRIMNSVTERKAKSLKNSDRESPPKASTTRGFIRASVRGLKSIPGVESDIDTFKKRRDILEDSRKSSKSPTTDDIRLLSKEDKILPVPKQETRIKSHTISTNTANANAVKKIKEEIEKREQEDKERKLYAILHPYAADNIKDKKDKDKILMPPPPSRERGATTSVVINSPALRASTLEGKVSVNTTRVPYGEEKRVLH